MLESMPGLPVGCLGVHGALAVGDEAGHVRDVLIAWREEGTALLTRRFHQAVDSGDLPPATDPHLLALYLRTVANGIAVQAASGSSRTELLHVGGPRVGQLAESVVTRALSREPGEAPSPTI